MHNNGAATVTTRASLSITTIVMYDQPQFIQCPTSPLQFLQRTMVQSILHTFTTRSLSLSPQLIYKPRQAHELPHCSFAKAPKSPCLIHPPTPTYTHSLKNAPPNPQPPSPRRPRRQRRCWSPPQGELQRLREADRRLRERTLFPQYPHCPVKQYADKQQTCQDKGDDSQLKPFACETRCLCHTVLLDPLCREKCKYDDPRTCPH